MILFFCIIGWMLFGTALYVIFNLTKRSEYLEEQLINSQQYIEQMSDAIKESKKRFDEADAKGLYKANDETGWFFKNLSYIQEILNNYILDEKKDNKTTPKS